MYPTTSNSIPYQPCSTSDIDKSIESSIFHIIKSWKQHEEMNEQILWYIHTKEYYAEIKMNQLPCLYYSQNDKTDKTEKRLVFAKGQR